MSFIARLFQCIFIMFAMVFANGCNSITVANSLLTYEQAVDRLNKDPKFVLTSEFQIHPQADQILDEYLSSQEKIDYVINSTFRNFMFVYPCRSLEDFNLSKVFGDMKYSYKFTLLKNGINYRDESFPINETRIKVRFGFIHDSDLQPQVKEHFKALNLMLSRLVGKKGVVPIDRSFHYEISRIEGEVADLNRNFFNCRETTVDPILFRIWSTNGGGGNF